MCLGLGIIDPLQARPDDAVFSTALAEYSASITAHTHFRMFCDGIVDIYMVVCLYIYIYSRAPGFIC